MNIAFYTLGCKVNQYETQVMAEALERAGQKIVTDIGLADCAVINSCTVTAESDRKREIDDFWDVEKLLPTK